MLNEANSDDSLEIWCDSDEQVQWITVCDINNGRHALLLDHSQLQKFPQILSQCSWDIFLKITFVASWLIISKIHFNSVNFSKQACFAKWTDKPWKFPLGMTPNSKGGSTTIWNFLKIFLFLKATDRPPVKTVVLLWWVQGMHLHQKRPFWSTFSQCSQCSCQKQNLGCWLVWGWDRLKRK